MKIWEINSKFRLRRQQKRKLIIFWPTTKLWLCSRSSGQCGSHHVRPIHQLTLRSWNGTRKNFYQIQNFRFFKRFPLILTNSKKHCIQFLLSVLILKSNPKKSYKMCQTLFFHLISHWLLSVLTLWKKIIFLESLKNS